MSESEIQYDVSLEKAPSFKIHHTEESNYQEVYFN